MPSGINAWLSFLTFDLLIKIAILHALLAVSMTNILLVIKVFSVLSMFLKLSMVPPQVCWGGGGATGFLCNSVTCCGIHVMEGEGGKQASCLAVEFPQGPVTLNTLQKNFYLICNLFST